MQHNVGLLHEPISVKAPLIAAWPGRGAREGLAKMFMAISVKGISIAAARVCADIAAFFRMEFL